MPTNNLATMAIATLLLSPLLYQQRGSKTMILLLWSIDGAIFHKVPGEKERKKVQRSGRRVEREKTKIVYRTERRKKRKKKKQADNMARKDL